MLPYWRKVMGAEECAEDLDEEGYCSHGKMLQGPAQDTVRTRNLADLKAPDNFQYFVRVG
jgi:hypothetical protein